MSSQEEIRGPAAASVAAPPTPGPEAKGRTPQEAPKAFGSRMLMILYFVALGGVILGFVVPYAWRTTRDQWGGFLASLDTLRQCAGLQCSLDAIGNAAQLMDFPSLGIGLAFWALFYKRHRLLGGIALSIFMPIYGHLAVMDKWKFWAAGLCFAAGVYWNVHPGGGDAGRIYLSVFSITVMLVRFGVTRAAGR